MTETGRFQEIRAKLVDKKKRDSHLVIDMRFSHEPEQKRAHPASSSQKNNPKKKQKIATKGKKPSEILLQRSMVFYAKPQRSKSSKIRWGLPKERMDSFFTADGSANKDRHLESHLNGLYVSI